MTRFQPLIVRYTHFAHVFVDSALGFLLIAQPFAEAHSADWVSIGLPEHWVTSALGIMLVSSNVLRRWAKKLDEVDVVSIQQPPIS